MAVTTTTRLAGPFIGNGATTIFSFAFKVFSSSDVTILQSDSAGNVSALVLGTDYSVALNANQDVSPGGSITLLSGPLLIGYRLIITSGIAALQEVVLTNLGGFYPSVLNGVFDKLTILLQQNATEIGQSIRMNVLDDTTSAQLPPAAARAGKLLAFDADGAVTLALPAAGEQGPPGTQGIQGPAGVTNYNGSNGPFNANGALLVRPSPNAVATNPSGLGIIDDLYIQYGKYGAGTNEGGGNWSTSHAVETNTYNQVRGIKQPFVFTMNNTGTGDIGAYVYHNTVAPGLLNGDDEGAVGLGVYVFEYPQNFTATIATTAGTGDTQPTLQNAGGLFAPPDQGVLLNLTRGSISGVMTARSTAFQGFLLQMPLTVTSGGSTLPLTTAWGTATLSLPLNAPTSNYQTATFSVSLQAVGGNTPAFVNGYARIAGPARTEVVPVYAAPASNGVQQLTIQYRYAHNGPVYLFQGPLVGQYMTWDADLSFCGKYLAHAVLGSLDGQNVIFAEYIQGARTGLSLPIAGAQGADPTVSSRAGFHCHYGAEITAVLSLPGTTPPVVQVEANIVPWTPGDSVVGAAASWWGGAAAHLISQVYTPTFNSFGQQGLWIDSRGPGIGGAYAHIRISGSNPDTNYQPYGGPLSKPYGITFDSSYDTQPVRVMVSANHPTDPLSLDPQASIISIANGFPNYNGTTYTGTTTAGSSSITLQAISSLVPSYAGIFKGDPVNGAGIPANTYLGPRGNTSQASTTWQLVDGNGNPVNATASSTTTQITVVAPRYGLYNSGFGSSLLVDGVVGGFRCLGNFAVDGKMVANNGVDARTSYVLVPDTLGNSSQSDTQAVNTESLQNLLASNYVAPSAAKYSGQLQISTGGTSTATLHFTNGILTSVSNP